MYVQINNCQLIAAWRQCGISQHHESVEIDQMENNGKNENKNLSAAIVVVVVDIIITL